MTFDETEHGKIFIVVNEIREILKDTHPEMVRLRARVDELLKENTRLVLENRELKKESCKCACGDYNRRTNGRFWSHSGNCCRGSNPTEVICRTLVDPFFNGEQS